MPMVQKPKFSNHIIHSLQILIQAIPVEIKPSLFSKCVSYPVLALRLYLLLNISLTVVPFLLFRADDDKFADVPLTPSQRALMGLSPSPPGAKPHPSPTTDSNVANSPTGASATPSSPTYITPPRYRRTSFSPSESSFQLPTPNSGRSTSATYSSSPLSNRDQTDLSPFRNISINSSPNLSLFSTPRRSSSSSSPFLQKALVSKNNNNTDLQFRTSFSPSPSPSGLRRSQSVRESNNSNSNSKKTSSSNNSTTPTRNPALNYKWLYQQLKRNHSRGLSGSGSVIGAGAGTGPGAGSPNPTPWKPPSQESKQV